MSKKYSASRKRPAQDDKAIVPGVTNPDTKSFNPTLSSLAEEFGPQSTSSKMKSSSFGEELDDSQFDEIEFEDSSSDEYHSFSDSDSIGEAGDEDSDLHPVTRAAIEKAFAYNSDDDHIKEGQDRDAGYALPTGHSKPHGREQLYQIPPSFSGKRFNLYGVPGSDDVTTKLGIPITGSTRGEEQVLGEFEAALEIKDANPPALKAPTSQKVRNTALVPIRFYDVHSKEILGEAREEIRDKEVEGERPSLSKIIQHGTVLVNEVEKEARVIKGEIRHLYAPHISAKPLPTPRKSSLKPGGGKGQGSGGGGVGIGL